jgi:CIC family chloride channel protein
MRSHVVRLWSWWIERNKSLLPIFFADSAPLDLRILGRTLLQAVAVGLVCGLVGALFFASLEVAQRWLLEFLAGYRPLRASGELTGAAEIHAPFRPWLLVLLPAVGGLLCGLLTRVAPEAGGGGGNVMIRAFHHQAGAIRARVIPIKILASIATLGTGGSGGREGPTMLVGGAVGSVVGRFLAIGSRERRVLLVAGVAAGIAAVFRTPLGAALLAVEVLYRDGFESDALVPAVLASVVSYSVVISIFGETTLLAHAPRFPFVPAHLPLYATLAIAIALLAIGFVSALRVVRGLLARHAVPAWLRPALGGLALGAFVTAIVVIVGPWVRTPGQGLGLLGGGYGAAQMAISGSPWLPGGWQAVQLLLLLSVAKLVASALTIGSGGSAGDFAPSLAMGALLGGAFGRAAALVIEDPRIDPAAFALVGMGAFYGGIAHAPLAALVLVCEMAGNYDLLVPLMFALPISVVLLRKRSLYEEQVRSPLESPAYRDALLGDVLRRLHVRDVMVAGPPPLAFQPRTSGNDMLRRSAESTFHELVPVLDDDGRLAGVVTASSLRVLAEEKRDAGWALAADVMQPAVSVRPEDDLRSACVRMLEARLREIPVVDGEGKVVGVLDEAAITRVYLQAAASADDTQRAMPVAPAPPPGPAEPAPSEPSPAEPRGS